jgi:hypothetical protein
MTAKESKKRRNRSNEKKGNFWKRLTYLFIVSSSAALSGWLLTPAFWSAGLFEMHPV